MPSVSVKSMLPAPRALVWKLLRNFDDLSAFLPDVVTLDCTGFGTGAVRRVRTSGGLFVERCESHDEDRCMVGYTVDEAPEMFPYKDYHAVFEIRELAPERSEIEWRCDFAVKDGDEEQLTEQLERLYRERFISNVLNTLSTRSPDH